MENLAIDEGLAAMIASLVAALSALIASFASIRSARLTSQLSAKQSVVGQDLKDLSHYLYEVIALSVEAAKSRSPERFDEKMADATSAAQALADLRIRHRYSLPFIFDPIWYLKGVPLYFQHYRNDLENPRLKLLQKRATELRKDIDLRLTNYFFYGRAPGYWARLRMKNKGKRLERAFLDGRPKKRT